MERVQVVIQANSRGMGLRPLTDKVPQALVPVAGKRFIELQIEQLVDQGFYEFIVIIGPMGHLIQAFLGSGARYGAEIKYAQEKQPLGSGGCLSIVAGLVKGPVLVVSGDAYLNTDYVALQRSFEQDPSKCIVAVHAGDSPTARNLRVRHDLLITEYGSGERMTHAYASASILTPHVLKAIPAEEASIQDALLRPRAAEGILRVHVVKHRAYDIQTSSRLAEFEKAYRTGSW